MDKIKDERIIRFLKKIKENYDDAEVYLFGSRAKGDNLESSDYDFLVISDKFKNEKTVMRLGEIYELWDEDIHANIIPHSYRKKEEMIKYLNIVKEAVTTGIKLL